MLCTRVWGLSHGWHPRGAPSTWNQERLGLDAYPPIWQAYQQAVTHLETWRATEATAHGAKDHPAVLGNYIPSICSVFLLDLLFLL